MSLSERAEITLTLIEIIVFDGHDELDVIGPAQVLRTAAQVGAPFQVKMVTREPQKLVVAAHGLTHVPDGVYSPGRAEMLVVPGGGWNARASVGTWGEVQRGDWLPLLKQEATRGTIMAGVCTGVMLLANAGVIGNRRAVTHHAAWDELTAAGATLEKDRVVDDGNLITSGGVTSGIDLGLWLVERFANRELADRIADGLEYKRMRPVEPFR